MNNIKNALNKYAVFILVLSVILIRLINFSFPFFTPEEARLAYRGYSLANNGMDELGRRYPLVFNSLEGYKLPLPSYLGAVGAFLFGKSELGARIPFIFVGVMIAIFTYMIAKTFNKGEDFRKISIAAVGFSPVLIYLSKVPNEFTVLTLLILILFYALTRKDMNLLLIFLLMLAAVITSKFSWLILTPFTILTLVVFQKTQTRKIKVLTLLFSVIISIAAILLFLQIPQAKRDLSENMFPLAGDMSIKNGIERLRDQGTQAGWPPLIERLLFNKLSYLQIGLMNWVSDLQLSTLFANFDKSGKLNYVGVGAFPKVLIIPFISGLILIIKRRDLTKYSLILYVLILSLPLMFAYRSLEYGSLVLTLPFIALIISLGLTAFSRRLKWIIFSLMVMELVPTLFFSMPQIKNTNDTRPIWIRPVLTAISQSNNPAVSDDLIEDLAPLYMWYTLNQPNLSFESIDFPYKYRQTKLGKMQIIGSETIFLSCTLEEQKNVFLSDRDLKRIPDNIDKITMKSYGDYLGRQKVYMNLEKICIR